MCENKTIMRGLDKRRVFQCLGVSLFQGLEFSLEQVHAPRWEIVSPLNTGLWPSAANAFAPDCNCSPFAFDAKDAPLFFTLNIRPAMFSYTADVNLSVAYRRRRKEIPTSTELTAALSSLWMRRPVIIPLFYSVFFSSLVRHVAERHSSLSDDGVMVRVGTDKGCVN